MEPDVIEISPPSPSTIASSSRTRKPIKAHEVIDVEQYEFRNVVDNKKNKGKAIQLSSLSDYHHQHHQHHHNHTHLANHGMEIDDYPMFQYILNSQNIPTNVEFLMPTPQFRGLDSRLTSRPSSLINPSYAPRPLGLDSSGTLRNQPPSKSNGNPSLETTYPPPWGLDSSVNPSLLNTYATRPWGLDSNSGTVRNQKPRKTNVNPLVAPPYVPPPWDFFSGLDLPQGISRTTDIAMVSSSSSRYDDVSASSSSSSSSRPIAVAKVITSAKEQFLQGFKRFDTVDDFSDHHYKGTTSKQPSKNMVKKIQEDWKILENDLPETIFVRACETRMDIMRAVIVGAEGTPYHDGLFFFDIQFPDTYPSLPPRVYYHSGGLRINPNLYNCGKVCLSLLGTWSGDAREKWLPNESTMLQLLVSIQALILNQKPYFNEPAYGPTKGTQSGEAQSKAYSENVFVLSLKTMVYSMKRPPKHFEEFVRSHYFVRAHDIVKACNAYKDGAPVGSMVKGGVQDLEESSQTGSKNFKTGVTNFIKTVVDEFVKLGVKDL